MIHPVTVCNVIDSNLIDCCDLLESLSYSYCVSLIIDGDDRSITISVRIDT